MLSNYSQMVQEVGVIIVLQNDEDEHQTVHVKVSQFWEKSCLKDGKTS